MGDVTGEMQFDVAGTLEKRRIDASGRLIGEAILETVNTNATHTAHSAVADTPHAAAESSGSGVPDGDGSCGSCFGAGQEGECCNTCDEVKEAYRRKNWEFPGDDNVPVCKKEKEVRQKSLTNAAHEGCNIQGALLVNKVAGNFHFALGKSYRRGTHLVHQFALKDINAFNCSHTVHSLNFGPPFPGSVNPLDGASVIATQRGANLGGQPDAVPDIETRPRGAAAVYPSAGVVQYFVKIVPTTYEHLGAGDGSTIRTNQYSVTEQIRPIDINKGTVLPGVFFIYDVSPFTVRKTEQRRSTWLRFLTRVCAIVGGVFTVGSLIDRIVFTREDTQ